MSESKHSMKLRHKAELKALLSQPAKGIGAKKKQKDDEKALMEKHEQQLKELEIKLSQATLDESTTEQPSSSTDQPTSTQSAVDSTTTQSNQSTESATRTETKSRAQLKREKKAQQDKERRAELLKETATMKDPRGEENAKLSVKLSPLGLQVQEVLSDGHCLFRAVSEQLDLIDHAQRQSYQTLRVAAAKHIRDHLDDYQPFLCSEDGEPFDQTQAQQYCESLKKLDGDIVWGGHAEIVALSDVLHHPIIVHSAEGEDLVVNGMSGGADKDTQPLHISFHKHYYGLGNHYNSCITIVNNSDSENEAE